MKPKPLTEAQFLDLLEKALAKVMPDLNVRSLIHEEVTREIRLHNHLATFTKFCETGSVPDLKPETVAGLQDQIAAGFGSDAKVAVSAPEEGKEDVAVEITLPDRTISSQIKVRPAGAPDPADDAPKAPFVSFPVVLPADAELVWVLARREDLGPDQAARVLADLQEDFWGSKTGQKLLREGEERTFAGFIARVPASALLESGLKRHYKDPEAIKTLQPLGAHAPGAGKGKGQPAPEPPPADAGNRHPLSDESGPDEDEAPWD